MFLWRELSRQYFSPDFLDLLFQLCANFKFCFQKIRFFCGLVGTRFKTIYVPAGLMDEITISIVLIIQCMISVSVEMQFFQIFTAC